MRFSLPQVVVTMSLVLLPMVSAQDRVTKRGTGSQGSKEGFPITGCTVFSKYEQEYQQYLRNNPEVVRANALRKKTAWNFREGDSYTWKATDIQTGRQYDVPSTCRKVGKDCYIFVEDALWNNARVNLSAAESIRQAWEERTPAASSQGIFQLDTLTFGSPRDTDGDPRIIILILDIRDGYVPGSGGGYVAGYYYSRDRQSNGADIYYIDGNPLDLRTSAGVEFAASTTAHEFQHMIHADHDPSELTFINESCSEVASLVCGYDYPGQNLYTDNTDTYLLGWSQSLADYSRAARWSLYVWNQFPNGYLKRLVQNSAVGILGYNNAFASYGTARRFATVFEDWLVANYLNDSSVDGRYAYTYFLPLTKPLALTYADPNTGVVNGTLQGLAARYYTFNGGSNLNILFSSSSSSLAVKAIKIGPGTRRVENVPLGMTYVEPTFGTIYTEVTFVVVNHQTDQQQGPASFSFQASGQVMPPPSAPSLVSPNDGELNVSTSPTFAWNPSDNASSYRLQLSRDGGFSNLVVNQAGISATSYQVLGLAGRTEYYWRVSASNIGGESGFSPARHFTTAALPSGAPVTLRYVDTTNIQQVFTVDGALPIDSGFVFGTNIYGDAAKATAFELPQGISHGVVSAVKVWFGYKRQGLTDKTYRLQIYSGIASTGPGILLHSQEFSSSSILADDNFSTRETATIFTLSQPVAVTSSFFVAIDFGFYGQSDYGAVGISSSGRLGRRVAEEWEKWEDGRWFNISDAWKNSMDGWNMWIEATVLTGTTNVEQTLTLRPSSFSLSQNYPNPFNPGTSITFEVPQTAHVDLSVYDVLGREVAQLVSEVLHPGSYRVSWNASGFPSGVYYYRFRSGGYSTSRTAVLLK